MAKKRWKFGSYTLKYNPKGISGDKQATGKTTVSVNGVVSVNNLFFDDSLNLEFDIYQKPTNFDRLPLKSFANGYYSSISEKKVTHELYCLHGTVIEILSETGVFSRQFNTVVVAGGTPVAIAETDNGLAVFYNNKTLVIQDENVTQIAKYTYTDIDFTDIVSITSQYGTNNIFAINKYGKIFRIYNNSSLYDLVYQFSDFAANKSATKIRYGAIHMIGTYLGVLCDSSKIYYFNPSFEVIHATEFGYRAIKDISFGDYSTNTVFIESLQATKAYPDYCGIDVDKVKSQLSLGAIPIVDDNNITTNLLIKECSIKRVRNKQDTRYEISINGKIM